MSERRAPHSHDECERCLSDRRMIRDLRNRLTSARKTIRRIREHRAERSAQAIVRRNVAAAEKVYEAELRKGAAPIELWRLSFDVVRAIGGGGEREAWMKTSDRWLEVVKGIRQDERPSYTYTPNPFTK